MTGMSDSNLRMLTNEEKELARLLDVAERQLESVRKAKFNAKEQAEKELNGKVLKSAKALVESLKSHLHDFEYDDMVNEIDSWQRGAEVRNLRQLCQTKLSLSQAASLYGDINNVKKAAAKL